jgi:hypothetical protein
MASQYPCIDPTMHIPKYILPKFEALKIVLQKESKGDALTWVFAKCAPHIQGPLRSTEGNSASYSVKERRWWQICHKI